MRQEETNQEFETNIYTLLCVGFPGGATNKEPPLSAQETQETSLQSLGPEDPPGAGHGNSRQYSCQENPMDGGAWWVTVHGVTQSQT